MRKHSWHPPILSALFLAAFVLSAHADDCGPLQKLMSLDLTKGPGDVASIPVTINGSPRKLLFSTAGGRSILSAGAADSLGLKALSTREKLLDSAGNVSQSYVTIDSLVIGGMEAKGDEFLISPDPNFGGNPQLPVDGALANDVMERYDLDLDYAGGKVSYFSPEHCDGHVIYWTTTPPSVIAFRHDMPGARNPTDTHIRFHVNMDGKDLLAVLNTGAARTTMSAKVADGDYDITADSKGTVPLGNMGGQKVFGYVFKAINFGDVAVSNPHIAILPDLVGRKDVNNAVRASGRIARVDDNLEPDITVGMDVISKLHIYVAEKEEKLYVTAAGSPAPAPAP